MNLIREEKADLSNIWSRIRRRDFSGNTGLAIKNSVYQFMATFFSKLGGFIITVILARLLMPELFGLYNLALSTILIFTSISDLGIGSALMKFLAEEMGKRNLKKARAYLKYLWKFKLLITLVVIAVLLASSKYISDVFYQKPIFLALVAGGLYVLLYSLSSFLSSILQSLNNFKGMFWGEMSFQASRIILVPAIVLLSIKYAFSNSSALFYIILALSAAYLLSAIFIFFVPMRKTKVLKAEKSSLEKGQKKEVNVFLTATAATAFSGIFFSYIDRIMLGHFVAAEFIGYYTAALSLITAVTALTGFSTVLLPIFSRMDQEKVYAGLKKSIRNVMLFSAAVFLGALALSPWIISLVYGSDYSPSTNILRIISPLVLLLPLIGIYSSYFLSKGKPWLVSNLLITATAVNIILNYVFITSLLKYGDLIAVYGSGTATVISQFLYLGALFISSRKERKKDLLPQKESQDKASS